MSASFASFPPQQLAALQTQLNVLRAQQAQLDALPPGVFEAQKQVIRAATAALEAQLRSFGPPVAPLQESPAIVSINGRLVQVQSQLASIEDQVGKNAATTSQLVGTSLDLAFANLYKLAVFVRGDYDRRDVDNNQLQALLQTIIASFQDVESKSTQGFNDLSTLHQQSLDLQSAQMTPLSSDVHNLEGQLNVEIAGYNQSISDANNNIANLQQKQAQALSNMATLQNKKQQAEQSATAADVGLGIATLGIWNLAGAIDHSKSPSAVIGIQNDIDALQNSINSINSDLNTANMNIYNLQQSKVHTEQTLREQQAVQAQLPTIEAKLDASIAKIGAIIQVLVKTKDVAGELVKRSSQLSNDATATHEAFLKKEFVDAILDICLLEASDKPRVAEILLITSDLSSQYGGKGMPADLQQKLNEVDAQTQTAA